jgi:hypothetical protein
MKTTLTALLLLVFSITLTGQEFEKGTIITTHYDTISNVQIKKISEAKSFLHIAYIDIDGIEQEPDIETIKCYTRGEEQFCRIYNSGEMVLAKQVTIGEKLNLYERVYNGNKIYYVEKVYDELIKVPSSSNKFKKVIGDFLNESPQLSEKIKSKELIDIKEIVNLYNEG